MLINSAIQPTLPISNSKINCFIALLNNKM